MQIQSHKLLIQNMVSKRCIIEVEHVLQQLEVQYKSIELGEVQLLAALSENQQTTLAEELHKSGLELMFDKKAVLIEKIIHLVIESVHHSTSPSAINFSQLLSNRTGMNYRYLADLFSKTKGITIEHYIMLHKIERVKELIMYDELSLSEIAFKMHYSSVAHLSAQFKKVTGLTPSFFKGLPVKRRKGLEDL